METGYSVIAPLYDRINEPLYRPYADFLREVIRQYSRTDVRDVLDLGCGTGRITALMADAGFNMVALDRSPDMLNYARAANEGKNTLLLQQDMRSFELYGTVQTIYSSFDCLNYIRQEKDLASVFRLAYNYLDPGGLFLFDVNTSYRMREIFGNNTFVYEFDGEILYWRNEVDAVYRYCRFILDRYYDMQPDGTCRYGREVQVEYVHSRNKLYALASEAGFLPQAIYTGLDFSVRAADAEKEYYVLLKPQSGGMV